MVLRPPADAAIPAGRLPFRVVARSVQVGGAAAEQQGVVDVAPVTRLELGIRPHRVSTDRSACFDVVLENRSNHQVTVDLEVKEPQYVVQLDVEPARVGIPASATAVVPLQAVVPGPAPDDPRPYPFTVSAVPVGRRTGVVPGATADGVVVHQFSPPAAYVATALGWLVGGLLAGLLLAGGWWLIRSLALTADGSPAPSEDADTEPPPEAAEGSAADTNSGLDAFLEAGIVTFGVVAVGLITLAAALGARRAIRSRRGRRPGGTAALLGLLTPLWIAAVTAGVAWAQSDGDAVVLAGVLLAAVAVNPPVTARWLILRGTDQPHRRVAGVRSAVASRSAGGLRPRITLSTVPAPRPTVPAPRPPVGSGPATLPDAPTASPRSEGIESSAGAAPVGAGPGGRSTRLKGIAVLAVAAVLLLAVGAGGAVLLTGSTDVSAEVLPPGAHVRVEPDRDAPTNGPALRPGETVTIVCVEAGWGKVDLPRPGNTFVWMGLLDAEEPPITCEE